MGFCLLAKIINFDDLWVFMHPKIVFDVGKC